MLLNVLIGFQVVKLLLDYHRLIDQVATEGSTRLQKLLETKFAAGITPLMTAIAMKDYATIELLVDAGADVNSCDHKGNTPILYVACSSSGGGIPSKESSPAIFQVYFVCFTLKQKFE